MTKLGIVVTGLALAAAVASVGEAPMIADPSADSTVLTAPPREPARIHLEVCAEDGSIGSLC